MTDFTHVKIIYKGKELADVETNKRLDTLKELEESGKLPKDYILDLEFKFRCKS